MASYTNEQYCEIVIIYGECQRNAREAARQYAQRFPTSPLPAHSTILNIVRRLRETGSVNPRSRSGRPRGGRFEVTPEAILGYALANPQLSTLEISTLQIMMFENKTQIMSESEFQTLLMFEIKAYSSPSMIFQLLVVSELLFKHVWCLIFDIRKIMCLKFKLLQFPHIELMKYFIKNLFEIQIRSLELINFLILKDSYKI